MNPVSAHRSAPPATADPRVQRLLLQAKELLGETVAQVTVCEQAGQRHTWGSCPFGGDDEMGLVLDPNTRVYQIPVWRLPQVTNCSACAGHLRPGGGMSRWLLDQLAPLAAALDALDAGAALAACTPTRLLPQESVTILIAHISDRFSLTCQLAGPVCLIERPHVPPERLPGGVHHGDGWSIVNAQDGDAALGEATWRDSGAGEDVAFTAQAFFSLRHRTTLDDQALWASAQAANRQPTL